MNESMRDGFEDWAKEERELGLTRNTSTLFDYYDIQTEDMWRCWKAAIQYWNSK